MKNKVIIVTLMLTMIFCLTGCNKKEVEITDARKFKEEYESINGKTNSNGKEYRSISVEEDNPFIYLTADELLNKINNGETLYVYFGDKLCPRCRSVIEKVVEVAKEKRIDKIYYVDIWDDKGNEVLRDKYILDYDNNPKQIIEGTSAYFELLKKFENLLPDYVLQDKEGNKVDVSEKRLFAPSFIYIKNGYAEKLVEGISSKQENSTADLTEEILKDEENIFNEFFTDVCSNNTYC